MLAIAAAVLLAIGQTLTAQTATDRATAARRKAAAAVAAKAQADDAVEEALVELDRLRAQTAAQLAAYQAATERAHTHACAELEEARGAAAKMVADAQQAAEAAIQKAIADRDRILAERTADMRQQIDRVKADAQVQVEMLKSQLAAAEAAQLVKTTGGELRYSTAVTHSGTGKATTELHQEATAAQQRAHIGASTTRAGGPSGRRKSKMTPAKIDKAQRMYDSRRFTVSEIAQACSVSPTTIYRHIHTSQTTKQ